MARDQSVDSFVSEEEEIIIRKKGVLVMHTYQGKILTQPKGPLFRTKFLRVVLDEAHLIRNKNTKVAKAAWDLEAEYRWSLTGTLVVSSSTKATFDMAERYR